MQQIQAKLKVQHSAQHSHKVLHMPSVLLQLDSSRTSAVLLNSNGDCVRAPRLGVYKASRERHVGMVSIPNVLDAFGCGLDIYNRQPVQELLAFPLYVCPRGWWQECRGYRSLYWPEGESPEPQ